MRLLIVEDNARVRRLIAGLVAPLATEIVECSDGILALQAYETHRPNVVLMDIAMRELDGIAATGAITSAHPEARVVIVTDYDEADLREAAGEAGACAYVLKDNLLELTQLLAQLPVQDRGSSTTTNTSEIGANLKRKTKGDPS